MPPTDPSSNELLETRSIGSSTPHSTSSVPPRTSGTWTGRYLAIEEIGRGGMGRVLRAYDPKLQREVALKVLHREAIDPLGRARMVREARSMARLNHPHVVAVYDVEDDPAHGVVLVMELVKGVTLREWLQPGERSSTEILQAFIEAGRGLAAAHDQGLLHRDFKPSNVLIANADVEGTKARGSCKVTDFGLAKPKLEENASGVPASATASLLRMIDHGETLTEDGAVMGTPLYMAPEQHRGAELTTAADQYAFCVALWQALVGRAPFLPPDLVAAKHRGPPPWSLTSVPRSVGEVLRRGLEPDPAQRWPDMATLLSALSPSPSRPRRRSWALLSAVGAFGLASAAWQASWWSHERHERERMTACRAAGDAIDAVWNGDARARVRQAVLATGLRYAETTVQGVMPWLDRYAASWKTARREVCLNAEVHRTWSTDTLDRALWCLEERRMDLSSLVAELAEADSGMTRRAVDSAAELPPVAPCTTDDLPSPPPMDQRTALDEVRRALSRATVLGAAHKYDEGLVLARSAREQAKSLRWSPLHVDAMATEGTLLYQSGSYAEAERILLEAFAGAVESSAWAVAHRVALDLVWTIGVRQTRIQEGWFWMRLADASGAHLEGPSELRVVSRFFAKAALHERKGEYPEALALYERALTMREDALGSHHPHVADVLSNLASIHGRMGAARVAIAYGERALAIYEQAFGRDHPRSSALLVNLASSHQLAGSLRQAEALFQRALAINEETLGPNHPKVALTLNGYASVLRAQGYDAEALALYERALTISESSLDPDHPQVAALLNNFANLLREIDPARARAFYERAVSINESVLGPDHPHVATGLVNVAVLEEDRTRAKRFLERALAIKEKVFGPHHMELESPLWGLYQLALEQDQPLVAIAHAERVVALLESSEASPTKIADAHHELALTLWDAPKGRGRDRDRATAMMLQAVAEYRAAGGHELEVSELEAWLTTHGSP